MASSRATCTLLQQGLFNQSRTRWGRNFSNKILEPTCDDFAKLVRLERVFMLCLILVSPIKHCGLWWGSALSLILFLPLKHYGLWWSMVSRNIWRFPLVLARVKRGLLLPFVLVAMRCRYSFNPNISAILMLNFFLIVLIYRPMLVPNSFQSNLANGRVAMIL